MLSMLINTPQNFDHLIEDRSFGNGLLVPELIPQKCFGKAPRTTISSRAWDRIRSHVYERAKYKCEICNSYKNLEAHERYLIHENTMYLRRLICVCKRCHSVIHIGLATKQKRFHSTFKHMLNVNKITKEEGIKIIQKSERVWMIQNTFVNNVNNEMLLNAFANLI